MRELTVIKKNGQREPFDRDKLARSIYIALRKRPVEPERVERIINSLVRQLESSGETDIPSDMIGGLVMEALATPRSSRLYPLRLGLPQLPRGQGFRRFRRADRRRWRLSSAGRCVDLRAMRAALALARRGLGTVWPNPAVGCVIVSKDGRVVGRGWTQPGGRPHGETEALRRAGEAARGATAYVSLEPCCHWGRTPPCTDALIAAGVQRVVVALEDPDPRVAGEGVRRLRAAGLAVETGLCAAEAAEINAGFFGRLRLGRPLVTLKLATSLDGRIATRLGESQWITGPPARERAHALRAAHDAIMVGTGTVIADDPQLTCRLPGLTHRSPVRIVIDRHLRIPPTMRLIAGARDVATWILTLASTDPARRQALLADGVVIVEVEPEPDGRIGLGCRPSGARRAWHHAPPRRRRRTTRRRLGARPPRRSG